jgi:hypothetical protein
MECVLGELESGRTVGVEKSDEVTGSRVLGLELCLDLD